MPRRPIGTCVLAAFTLLLFCASTHAAAPALPLRAGIIGLDAHARTWTNILNNPEATGELGDMTVVAGYPGGSPDIPQSMELLEKGIEAFGQMDVEIVDSIDALVEKVDVVMILSIDGRSHLEQARPVIEAGKPLFIDKPMAGSLADAIRIFDLAKKAGVPCFSSSSLRFAPGTQAVLGDPKVGEILGCDAFSPCALEPHHPDFFWYGIHGVETLFTIMGTGCKTVARTQTEHSEMAVGVWEDGRIGTFRGTREGLHTYGATVFGSKAVVPSGKFEGYEPLLVEIVKFFKTGRPPVDPKTTLEILAFMEAADQSKREGGRPVSIQSVMDAAKQAARTVAIRVEVKADEQILLDGDSVTLKQLPARLAALAKEDAVVEVTIVADPTLRTRRAQAILSACQAGGAHRVRLSALKPGSPR